MMLIFCPECNQNEFKPAEKQNRNARCSFCEQDNKANIILECDRHDTEGNKCSGKICLKCSFNFRDEDDNPSTCIIEHNIEEISNLEKNESKQLEVWRCDICLMINRTKIRRDRLCGFTVCESCFR